MLNNELDYIDVDNTKELDALPQGMRYLDFLGGTKELRCFIVSEDMPRSLFIDNYEHLLDECLEPIYEKDGICVRQDASYALPGFYIVGFEGHYKSLDDMDEKKHLRANLLIQNLRKGMREVLDIPYIHLYYEEKPSASGHVHYWLLPFHSAEEKRKHSIYNMDVKSYLEDFSFQENKAQILLNNKKMRQYLFDNNFSAVDDALINSDFLPQSKSKTVLSMA